MPGQDEPEIATTDEFRIEMRRAREAEGLSQEQLGRSVGVSQNVISKIESGEVKQSSAILPIVRVLKIRPPLTVFGDTAMQRWASAGYLLRDADEELFESQTIVMEDLARRAKRLRDGQP